MSAKTKAAKAVLGHDQIYVRKEKDGAEIVYLDSTDQPVDAAKQAEIDAYVVPVTGNEVNAQREERINTGTNITLSGGGPTIGLTGREKDQINLQGLVTDAQIKIANGDTTTVTVFRDRDNNMHNLTPPQVVELWQLGASYISSVYIASWALKASAIPQDYTDDSYWP